MGTKLVYPNLSYVKLGKWQLANKIEWVTTYRPTIWSNSSNSLYVSFEADLTQQQIDLVNAIMNSADSQGPDNVLMVQNNSYIITDIWEYNQVVASETGIDFRVYYRHSGNLPGNYYPDEIVIVPVGPMGGQRILTNPQKNDLVNAINSRNRWE